jgi:hypothetical protein
MDARVVHVEMGGLFGRGARRVYHLFHLRPKRARVGRAAIGILVRGHLEQVRHARRPTIQASITSHYSGRIRLLAAC